MNIFKKSKKKDSCCAIQFEEVKEDNNKKETCNEIVNEPVTDKKKTKIEKRSN